MKLIRQSLLALVPLLAACATQMETAPAEGANREIETPAVTPAVAGTYQLVRVNNQELPVYVGSYENCREYVVSGSLELQPEGRYLFSPLMREQCEGEVERDRDGEREMGTYTVAGDNLQLYEEAIEVEGMNRWEDEGSDPEEIPIEDLGGSAVLEDGMLTVQLVDGQNTATFRR